jgi:DNA polymerase-1
METSGVLKDALIFDIESHDSSLLFSMSPEEFVRLIGYRWVGHPTVITTDLDEIRNAIRQADTIVGHNIWNFDLRAIFGVHSTECLERVLRGDLVVYDTWVHAVLVHPAPYTYTNRLGKGAKAEDVGQLKKWFSLDEQAHQLGVVGKTADLKKLAKIHGGFGSIPQDDPEYVDYLRGDIDATEAVARALLALGPLDQYALREQEIAARAAVISSNGLRLDVQAAQARVDQLAARREPLVAQLQKNYGLPTEGKAPWATNEGKAAILAALSDHGITPESRPDWPLTDTKNLSFGGDALIMLTKGTAAEDMGQALAELKGQRSLAQLALDSVHPDGFVHPDITMLQRSGRWSTTNPGLTVWTSRGEGAVEKAYFLPDSDDEVLLEVDYSNADARMVAALSGDRKFVERFEPGADGHTINAIAAWGEEVVATDPKGYRQKAKVPSHGWGYKIGAKKLASQTGMPLKEAAAFLSSMDKAFPGVVGWQAESTQRARRMGYVISEWGRKLWVEKGREFTQAPALEGQNGTREIVCDALLAMPIPVLKRVKAQIHDALLFSVPKDSFEEYRDYLVDLMTTYFRPKRRGSQSMEFPCEAGPPGANWYEAGH